jgi:hypothetical protein
MRVTAGVDGETIAVLSATHLGGMDLEDDHIVRISAGGDIVAVRPVVPGLSNVGPRIARIDAHGRPVAVWSSEAASIIIAFDENLERRWNATITGVPYDACCTLNQGMFHVGGDGEVAFTTTNANGNYTLHYLGNDGVERWTADARFPDHLLIAASGDVLLYRLGLRVRFRASDGVIVDEIAHPRPTAVAPDEHSVAVDSESSSITLHEPGGDVRWSVSIPGYYACPFGGCGPSIEDNALIMLGGDDVLVRVHEHEQVRLDGTSGERIGSMLHCEEMGFEFADATGYLGRGRNCDGNFVLAKFPLPD